MSLLELRVLTMLDRFPESARLSTRTGRSGGEPNPDSSRIEIQCGPQIRPWHGPIPQRVCSFAARQECMALKPGIGNIFAAAYDRFGEARLRVRPQTEMCDPASARRLRTFLVREEFAEPLPVRPAAARPAISPSMSDRLDAADAGRFASAKCIGHGRSLKVIDLHTAVFRSGSRAGGKLGVGNQMKSAGQIVAGDLF